MRRAEKAVGSRRGPGGLGAWGMNGLECTFMCMCAYVLA